MDNEIVPRYFQLGIRDACLEAIARGIRRMYYVAPTGTGKTVALCLILESLREVKRPAVIIAHRTELIKQARKAVLKSNPALKVGIEQANIRAPYGCDVVVTSVQTIGRDGSKRLSWIKQVGGPSVVIVDECHHHTPNDGYARAIDSITAGTSPIVIGCTATDDRTDRLGLSGYDGAPFQAKVYEYPIQTAIADKNLCEIHAFAVASETDLSTIKTVRGDFAQGELEEAVNVEVRTAKAIEHWEEIAKERRTIVFCVGVSHAMAAAQAWSERGYSAEPVWGDMDKAKRESVLAAHKSGAVQILTNVGVLTEGYDDPDVSCIVMLRPTKSRILFSQSIGRGTRPNKSGEFKDLYVIDVVDNTSSHALDVKGATNATKKKSPQITLASMLGLPDAIDLEGHSVTECVSLREELSRQASLFADMQPESYSQIRTLLARASLFAGVSDSDHAKADHNSPYRWIYVGNDWVLSLGTDEWIRLRLNANGNWCYKMVWFNKMAESMGGLPKQDERGNLETPETRVAIAKADIIALEIWGDRKMGFVHAQSPWRQNRPSDKQIKLLIQFGVPESAARHMTRGEASATITKKLESRR